MSVSVSASTNKNIEIDIEIGMYIYDKYDKYDIIDFLELEYIDDWLDQIPQKIWKKYHVDILHHLPKIKNFKMLEYIIKKIDINLPHYIVESFECITLDILKFCVETNFEMLKKYIKMNCNIYERILSLCFSHHNLEFNKYFYENLYIVLEQELFFNPIQIQSQIKTPKPHSNNLLYKVINASFNKYSTCKDFRVIKYYNEKFPKIFELQKNVKISSDSRFLYIFDYSKINNLEDMIELQNIINIKDIDIINIMYNILRCVFQTSNVDFVFKILNKYWSKNFLENKFICPIMVHASLKKNYELVSLLYNFFSYSKNFTFDSSCLSIIIYNIIKSSGKKHIEYDKIIYEFIHMGGVVNGYPIYSNYIKSIKIY